MNKKILRRKVPKNYVGVLCSGTLPDAGLFRPNLVCSGTLPDAENGKKNEKLVRVGLQPLVCRYNSRITLLSGRTITVEFCRDIRAEKDRKRWLECPSHLNIIGETRF